MDLILFDMDGVLLEPNGYHRALHDTVHRAAAELGYPNISLTKQQIARFESLGISNEWHSSAMCIAVLGLNPTGMSPTPARYKNGHIDLEPLFDQLGRQPMHVLPLERAVAALTFLATEDGSFKDGVVEVVRNSEVIQLSPTMNIFQELILGSRAFEETYKKRGRFETESYLKLHDRVILKPRNAEWVKKWTIESGHGAAIMTNRPSQGLPGVESAPDGALGAKLVDVSELPLVGFGEMNWLASTLDEPGVNLIKPSWQHALAAVLAATGWPIEASLRRVGQLTQGRTGKDLEFLQSSRVTVFEDTPGGLLAVKRCAEMLHENKIDIEVQLIGIAKEPNKQLTLEAQGGKVYANINQALGELFH